MSIRTALRSFDHRRPWFGVGRTILTSAQILLLALTSPTALLVPVGGGESGPFCGGVSAASAYCVGGDILEPTVRHWIILALLLVVASGFSPRFTGILHAWLTFSIAGSITLPDGGELAAKIIALFIIPMCLADDRLWHWQRPTKPLEGTWRGIAYASLWAVRVQVAGIYLHSGLGKLASEDWLAGTAEYYVLKDDMFGAAGWVRELGVMLMSAPPLVFAVTWGSILLEVFIALAILLGGDRTRRIALTLVVVFHVAIIVTIGLWTFALCMIGAVILAALPDTPRPKDARTVDYIRRSWTPRRALTTVGLLAADPPQLAVAGTTEERR